MPPSAERPNRHRYENNNSTNSDMIPPQLSSEQVQDFYTQRIFGAALERVATNPAAAANGQQNEVMIDPTSLMRHARAVAAEVPPAESMDETYVLQLQSQLALALNSMENMQHAQAQQRQSQSDQEQEEEQEVEPEVSASSSARQLAEASARRSHRSRRTRNPNRFPRSSRQDDINAESEASLSLGMVASLQVEFSRTRERMSDALSIARSHSNRSISFPGGLNDGSDDGDASSLLLDDLVVGPLEQDLNDIEPERPQQQVQVAQQENDNNEENNDQEEEQEGDEAEMLASIASLQFDLLQTREKLMDERSFTRSHRASTSCNANDLGASTSNEIAATSAESQSTIGTLPAAPTAAPQATATTTTSTPAAAAASASQANTTTTNDATERLAALGYGVPKPNSASVQGARMRSSNLHFRRFSNQQA